jgi:hypothetical protein
LCKPGADELGSEGDEDDGVAQVRMRRKIGVKAQRCGRSQKRKVRRTWTPRKALFFTKTLNNLMIIPEKEK